MFNFFKDRNWMPWSILVTLIIIAMGGGQVYIDLLLNDWIGTFYNTLQKAISTPNSVSTTEFMSPMAIFAGLAGIWVCIAAINGFIVSHWTFRWRTSMAERYHDLWQDARSIEGASQRVQEDTLKFARYVESLGTGFMDSIFTLIAFTPLLWILSKQVTHLPWIGEVSHALVWVAIVAALGGILIMSIVGIKLPGIEYDIQVEEASYRKELVLGENDLAYVKPPTIAELFSRVRKIHFKSYFHYFYFNFMKWSYFQGMVLVPYLALAPTIVTGAVTLGFIQQTVRAFNRVESSLQYLVKSWGLIVELMSVWKRLREFESRLAK